MTQGILTFDADTHTYWIGDRIVPGVTQVIREVLAPNEYAGIPAHVLEHAAQRGRAVERMIELDLRDDLDLDAIHTELVPYWQAWERFPERLQWRSEAPECQQMVVETDRFYAGTFDIHLRSSGRLIDIKATALVPATVGVQTAAYAYALGMGAPHRITRHCLHVTPNGCKLIHLTNKSDSADFLAALRCYNWRRRNDA